MGGFSGLLTPASVVAVEVPDDAVDDPLQPKFERAVRVRRGVVSPSDRLPHPTRYGVSFVTHDFLKQWCIALPPVGVGFHVRGAQQRDDKIHLKVRQSQPVDGAQALVWPVGFLSTVFVSAETMPGWLGTIAAWNPVSATAIAVRGLFGNPTGTRSGWLAENALFASRLWPLAITAVFLPLAAMG